MEFEIILKIILSSLLGGIFGISREISGKGSGIRTIFLISTSSTLLTIISLKLPKIVNGTDPSLIIGFIIISTGLISSSALIRSVVFRTGLLSASVLWSSSTIGICVGLGLYVHAFLITVLVITLLGLFKYIDMKFQDRSKTSSYTIKVKKKISILSDIKKLLMECGINNYEWHYEKIKGGFLLELTISVSANKDNHFAEKLLEMDNIEEIRNEII